MNLLTSTTLRTNKVYFYDISNLDIKMTYIANEKKAQKEWMTQVFVQTKFFAESRANKYKKIFSKEDLLQEAYLGLWEAILTYDYQKNFDFYRWAQWNISKKIRDYNSKSKRFFAVKSSIKRDLSSCNYNCFLESQEVELERSIVYKKLFSDAGSVLSKIERQVVMDNLVLGKKLKETAKDLDLSAERIRQIRNCSLYKIKRLLS